MPYKNPPENRRRLGGYHRDGQPKLSDRVEPGDGAHFDANSLLLNPDWPEINQLRAMHPDRRYEDAPELTKRKEKQNGGSSNRTVGSDSLSSSRIKDC